MFFIFKNDTWVLKVNIIKIVYIVTIFLSFIQKKYFKKEDIFTKPNLKDQSFNNIGIKGFESIL